MSIKLKRMVRRSMIEAVKQIGAIVRQIDRYEAWQKNAQNKAAQLHADILEKLRNQLEDVKRQVADDFVDYENELVEPGTGKVQLPVGTLETSKTKAFTVTDKAALAQWLKEAGYYEDVTEPGERKLNTKALEKLLDANEELRAQLKGGRYVSRRWLYIKLPSQLVHGKRRKAVSSSIMISEDPA